MVKENNRDAGNVKLFQKIIGIASLLKMNHRYRIALKIDHRRGLSQDTYLLYNYWLVRLLYNLENDCVLCLLDYICDWVCNMETDFHFPVEPVWHGYNLHIYLHSQVVPRALSISISLCIKSRALILVPSCQRNLRPGLQYDHNSLIMITIWCSI